MRKAIAVLALAGLGVIPAAGSATGSWNCSVATKAWANCTPWTLTNGSSSIQVFNDGALYRWLVIVYDNFNQKHTYGPIVQSGVARHYVATVRGTALMQVYNDATTGRLFNVQVS